MSVAAVSRLLALPAAISLTLALAGCDGGDSAAAPAPAPVAMSSHVVVPSLGQVFNGDVRVLTAGGSAGVAATLAVGRTGVDGTVRVDLPVDAVGPFIIEVSGNVDAEYYDEGLDQRVPFRAGDVIRAVLATLPAENIAVTPLTELAIQHLESEVGDLKTLSRARLDELLDAGAIAAANTRIRDELAPELDDILAAPALVGSAGDMAALGAGAKDLYALKLAALARIASSRTGSTQPALEIMRELADDIADGSLDGRQGLLALAPQTHDIESLANRLHEAAAEMSASSPLLALKLAEVDHYVSPFLAALAAVKETHEAGDPVALPRDLLSAWAGNYQGDWNIETLEAKIYVWPLGWRRDYVTELALKVSMDLLTFGGDTCHWNVQPQNLSFGTIDVPFGDAFAVAATGDMRTYTLPTKLTVMDFGVTATTTMETQGLLPTRTSLDYNYKGPLKQLRYKASCTFSYAI